MGDLNTPPPSYETVMGTTGTITQANQSYRSTMRPSAPKDDNDVVSAPITAPILPRWSRSYISATPQQPRPVDSTTNYSANRPIQQSNNLRRQDSNDNEKHLCTCIAVALIMVLGAFVLFLALMGRANSTASSDTDSRYSDNG